MSLLLLFFLAFTKMIRKKGCTVYRSFVYFETNYSIGFHIKKFSFFKQKINLIFTSVSFFCTLNLRLFYKEEQSVSYQEMIFLFLGGL